MPNRLCPRCGTLHTQPRCPTCKPHRRTPPRRSTGYDTRHWRKLKAQVFARDHHTCQRCGTTRAAGAQLHAHHITPRRLGGTDTLQNVVTLCSRCHPIVEAANR